MRLDFNVLWIDNQPDNVKSIRDAFAHKIRDEGFRLIVTDAVSLEAAQDHLGESVFLDGIDLVLVDYDLGAGVLQGDEAVRAIRNRVAYKDIILYSAKTARDLKELVLKNGIEGVFCAHRTDLADTIMGAFDALVKKVLDIDHIRGIVMGVTSDIDYIVLESLYALVPRLAAEHSQAAVTYALNKLDERLERFTKTRDALANSKSLDDILAAHEAFPAEHRLGLLKEVMGLHFNYDHAKTRKAIGKYANDIPTKRNTLGHVRLVAAGGVRKLVGRGEAKSYDELLELRRLLIDYRDDFDELATIVGLAVEEASGGHGEAVTNIPL